MDNKVDQYKIMAEHYQCVPHDGRVSIIEDFKYVIVEILDNMDEIECMNFLLKATDQNIEDNYK